MEISDVRRRVHETIERARRQAAERRTRSDEASREFEAFQEMLSGTPGVASSDWNASAPRPV